MKELIVKSAIDLAAVLLPLILGLVANLVKKWSDKLKADTDNKLAGAALSKVTTLAYVVVSEVSQTIVADLKAAAVDGKLTDEEKAQIKASAVAKLKSYISLDEAKRLIGVGDIDSFLGTLIESAVSETKPLPK